MTKHVNIYTVNNKLYLEIFPFENEIELFQYMSKDDKIDPYTKRLMELQRQFAYLYIENT